MNRLRKLISAQALLDYLKTAAPDMPVYVSFTLHDPQTISDGTTIQEAVTAIDGDQQVFAVGINCVSPKIVTAAVKEIHRFTDKPIVVYPNLGASYNPATKKWEEIHAQFDFTALAREWYQHGARLIGGCCTMGPEQVKEIAAFYQTLK